MRVHVSRRSVRSAILAACVGVSATLVMMRPSSLVAEDVAIYVVFDDITDSYQEPPKARKDNRGWGDGAGGGRNH